MISRTNFSSIKPLLGLTLAVLLTIQLNFNFVLTKELKSVESKRPFVDFEIKSLNLENETKKRTLAEIKDLPTAASYLEESFINKRHHIKCSAYGYLFKTIKNKQQASAPKTAHNGDKSISTSGAKAIRLSYVHLLSVVINKYWPSYYKQLVDNKRQYVDYFKEALEGLLFGRKQFANSRAAAFDLIHCLKDYSSVGKEDEEFYKTLDSYLKELNLWLMFKAQPLLSAPRGAKRKHQRSMSMSKVEKDLLNKFYKNSLESFKTYSNETLNTEFKINNKESIVKSKPILPFGKLIESHEPIGVWLINNSEDISDSSRQKFNIEQLKELEYIKFRFLHLKKNKIKFKLSLSLALDFVNNWKALRDYVESVSATTSAKQAGQQEKEKEQKQQQNKRALDFYKNEDNIDMAEQIETIIKLYMKHSSVIYRMSRKNFKFSSFTNYCNAIRKAKDSLNKINGQSNILDLDDYYRVYDFWYKTHTATCAQVWPKNNNLF